MRLESRTSPESLAIAFHGNDAMRRRGASSVVEDSGALGVDESAGLRPSGHPCLAARPRS